MPRAIHWSLSEYSSTTSPSPGLPSTAAMAESKTQGCRAKKGRDLRGLSRTIARPPASGSEVAADGTEETSASGEDSDIGDSVEIGSLHGEPCAARAGRSAHRSGCA